MLFSTWIRVVVSRRGFHRSVSVRCAAVAIMAMLCCVMPPRQVFAQNSDPSAGQLTPPVGGALIESDFALSIDGQFVIGTRGDSSVAPRLRIWKGAFHSDLGYTSRVENPRNASAKPSGAALVVSANKLPEARKVHVFSRPDEPFAISASKDDETYTIVNRASPRSDARFDLVVVVKHNEVVVVQRHLVVAANSPYAIEFDRQELGNAGSAGHIRLEISMQSTDMSSLPAIARDGGAASGAPHAMDKPLQNQEYRRMRPPRYPVSAVRNHISGKVLVSVISDASGVPQSAEVFGIEPAGALELGGAALAAVMQWRFIPGEHIDSTGHRNTSVPIDFNLEAENGGPLDLAPPDPDRPLGVSYRKITAPEYPAHARLAKLAGTVILSVQIAADGSLTAARVEQVSPEGAAELGEAALSAVRAWQFNPASLEGKPVASEARIPVVFAVEATPYVGIGANGNVLEAVVVEIPDSPSSP